MQSPQLCSTASYTTPYIKDLFGRFWQMLGELTIPFDSKRVAFRADLLSIGAQD